MIKIPNQANLKFQMMTDNSLHPNNHNKNSKNLQHPGHPKTPLAIFYFFCYTYGNN